MTEVLGSTAQRVRQQIQQLMESGGSEGGDLASGDSGGALRLPPERELARRFGVARNTLRQALGLLEDEGLLLREVGRGTFLKRQTAPASASGAAGTHRPAGSVTSSLADASPADIMEARQIFEPHAAALAAARAGSEDLSQLREALRRSLEAKSIETFERWDAEIHYLIFKATKNAVLLHYCDQINEVRRQPTWVKLKKRSLTPERRALYDKQHKALVEAILARDPDEAYRLSRAHALEVKQNLLGD